MNVDDDPEDIRWIRVLGGDRLPAASNSLLLNLKKSYSFYHRRGSSIFVACVIHSSAQISLYQTPGRRPPRITGRFVNTAVTTVQISWRSRWYCRSMSVEDSESHRFELKFVEFSQGDLGPTSVQELLLSDFLKEPLVWNFFFIILCS